jgi:hypothetical protein
MDATWRLTLLCYNCNASFTIEGVEAANIDAAAESSACPHCEAKSLGAKTFPPPLKRHVILSLSPEER